MQERLLTGVMLLTLSGVFGCSGIGALSRAFHAKNTSVWVEEAIQGGLGIVGGGFFVEVVLRLVA